jgi:hypothetical protein
MLELGRREDAAPLADRVRLRAMRLAKSQAAHRSQILTGAESLVLAVYRHAIPRGWMCGFCDASVAAYGDGRASGVGGIILDASGRTVARISRRGADREPFEAEIAALEATLDAAAGLGETTLRIRVYTDCDALVALWLQRRGDPRLRSPRAGPPPAGVSASPPAAPPQPGCASSGAQWGSVLRGFARSEVATRGAHGYFQSGSAARDCPI